MRQAMPRRRRREYLFRRKQKQLPISSRVSVRDKVPVYIRTTVYTRKKLRPGPRRCNNKIYARHHQMHDVWNN
jgi:hypothetical protein